MKPAVKIIFAPLARRGARRTDPDFEAHVQGEASGRTIKLDPRMPNVGKTLLHELCHIRNPSWSEDRVLAWEEYKWGKMGWREKARLYQLLGGAKLEGE